MYDLLQIGDVEVWTKPILPFGSYALALVNMGNATPTKISVILSDFGLPGISGYNVTEVFDGTYLGLFKLSSKLEVYVNPTGVFFAQAIAVP